MMNTKNLYVLLCLAALVAGCQSTDKKVAQEQEKNLTDTVGFGGDVDGQKVGIYKIGTEKGISASITNYGGRVVSLMVPDAKGKLVDVALGYDSLKTYQKEGEPFFGALIGRYGNRIAKGKFTLNGKAYQLEINDGVNTLHGGKSGFYGKVWNVEKSTADSLVLSYLSKDGEGGYPGTLNVKVVYSINKEKGLKIDYEATTNKETVVNLTNHTYFNLSGEGAKTILDHELWIKAARFTPVDKTLIPTGKLQEVKGTPFDFTKAKPIGRDIKNTDEQLKNGEGYDHNFVLDTHDYTQSITSVRSPLSGIKMDVYTTEPGIQFYSGNFLTGKTTDGKKGKSYPQRSAFCLETQHFPDAPNQPAFPSTVLKPGAVYKTSTTYVFSATEPAP